MRNRSIKNIISNLLPFKISPLRFFINFFCVVGIILIGTNIINVVNLGIERYNLIQDEVETLALLKEEEAQLKAELDWFTSLDFIESQSRDYLNLSNEGDLILVVPDYFSEVQKDSSEEEELLSLSPDISLWWKLLF